MFSDLRQISIRCGLSITFEKIRDTQFGIYLLDNKTSPTTQSHFRPGHSCTTALLKITDGLIKSCDD